MRCRYPATSLTMKLSVCSPNFPRVLKPSLFIHGSHDGVESPLDVHQPSCLRCGQKCVPGPQPVGTPQKPLRQFQEGPLGIDQAKHLRHRPAFGRDRVLKTFVPIFHVPLIGLSTQIRSGLSAQQIRQLREVHRYAAGSSLVERSVTGARDLAWDDFE